MSITQAGVNGDCDDCCMTCCCIGCSAIGYAFCLKKMRRSVRIKLCLVYLNVLCVTCCVIIAKAMFGPFESVYSPMDMRWINERQSFIFCGGIKIYEKGGAGRFSAYLLESEPVVNQSKRQTYSTETTVFINKGSYIYHEFYLLKGSIITTDICADAIGQMFLIKGKNNFNSFVENNFDCVSCFEKETTYNGGKCVKTSDFINTIYMVSSTDDYFIVYTSLDASAWLSAIYNINRTLFELSGARHYCSSSYRCGFTFDFKEQFVIVQLEYNETLKQDQIITECSSRPWIYLVIFFPGPYLLGIIICILIYKCCKDPDQTVINGESSVSSRSPLLPASNFNIYQSTAEMGPPKYEDIIRYDEAKPPSYDEAVGSTNNSNQ